LLPLLLLAFSAPAGALNTRQLLRLVWGLVAVSELRVARAAALFCGSRLLSHLPEITANFLSCSVCSCWQSLTVCSALAHVVLAVAPFLAYVDHQQGFSVGMVGCLAVGLPGPAAQA
jgi:hypothetical protein